MEVIILAGGLGTRLSTVVHEIPKCLAPVGSDEAGKGRPFLAYQLNWLATYPVQHVVFSVGYLKEQVIEFVQSREWPFAYDFAEEETPLGTGGAIRLALTKCRSSKVFVLNGDTFYPVPLDRMPFDYPLTLALKPMKDFDRYGTVSLSCTKITAFHEKQACPEGLINGGIYAIDRTRLDLSALPERFSFEKEVLEPEAAKGLLGGWVSDSYFIDIGIPEDYTRAQWAVPAWFAVKEASKAVLQTSAQTLFLDRDGVLNRLRPADYVKSWNEWEWMPGILEEFPKWAAKFQNIVLVTNQRGVGKGVMTDRDLSHIHARMMTEILDAGGRIDLLLACTAVSDENPRRKPHTGMFYEAAALLDIKAESSVMLGDAPSDAAFAANCGMDFIPLLPAAVS